MSFSLFGLVPMDAVLFVLLHASTPVDHHRRHARMAHYEVSSGGRLVFQSPSSKSNQFHLLIRFDILSIIPLNPLLVRLQKKNASFFVCSSWNVGARYSGGVHATRGYRCARVLRKAAVHAVSRRRRRLPAHKGAAIGVNSGKRTR